VRRIIDQKHRAWLFFFEEGKRKIKLPKKKDPKPIYQKVFCASMSKNEDRDQGGHVFS